jgi:hypothetical protein
VDETVKQGHLAGQVLVERAVGPGSLVGRSQRRVWANICKNAQMRRLPRARHVKTAYREELRPARRTSLISWVAFTGTFALVRAITYSIKDGRGPLRDVTVGGIHLHHYLWGILTLTVVGGVAIRGEDPQVTHPVLATAYGAGLALVVDEFALLLDLKDVYWAKQGRASVDLAILVISTGGSIFVAEPVLGRLHRDYQKRIVDQ